MTGTHTRPGAHFTARSGWINDPHGLTVVDGTYHLFFQHVPGSIEWKPSCHWGHAVSADLVHWEERPIALAPGDGDDGIWSGSVAVDDDGQVHAYYTSIHVPDFGVGRVRVARPRDASLDDWEKGEVVVELPEELDAIAFRDPFVRRDGDGWRMLVGTALRDGTAAAASFTSPDQQTWTYDGLAASRSRSETEPVWTGSLWECPQLFEVDDVEVLLSSIWDDDDLYYVAYSIVDREGTELVPREWQRLTYGESYYAPTFFRDRDGQPCLMFWLRGARDAQAGWAGAHSVPYLLHVSDGSLHLDVHPEVRTALDRTSGRDDLSPRIATWTAPEEELVLTSEDGPLAHLRLTPDGLQVTAQEGTHTVPSARDGDVHVLADGPVVEVSLSDAVYAVGASSDVMVERVRPSAV